MAEALIYVIRGPNVIVTLNLITDTCGMTSDIHLQAFIARQRELLLKERNAEIERTSLLLTKCGPKLLEQKGLAIGSLGVVNMNVGLGGKT